VSALLPHRTDVGRGPSLVAGPRPFHSSDKGRSLQLVFDLACVQTDALRSANSWASCRETVIIAVTGYGQEDDRRRSRAVGIDHHLLKPVASQVLMSLLSRSEAMSVAAG
jgi:response regulator RpfG family c-di-GMP phosphodiesterase